MKLPGRNQKRFDFLEMQEFEIRINTVAIFRALKAAFATRFHPFSPF
jgi:hypothetical protein